MASRYLRNCGRCGDCFSLLADSRPRSDIICPACSEGRIDYEFLGWVFRYDDRSVEEEVA